LFAVQQTHAQKGLNIDLLIALNFITLEGSAVQYFVKLRGRIFERLPCGSVQLFPQGLSCDKTLLTTGLFGSSDCLTESKYVDLVEGQTELKLVECA